MKTVAVIGAGAWGTALALLLCRNGLKVSLWARTASQAQEISAHRENRPYLRGVALPGEMTVTADPRKALAEAEFLVAAIPAQAWRMAGPLFAPLIADAMPIVLCMKGIERDTLLLPHEVTAAMFPDARPVLLSGPSFAADVAEGLPAAVTLAAADEQTGASMAGAFSGPAFRPYLSGDLTGVALGGAAKNVLAIACGIVSGAGLGESARAALAARGFAEIMRLAAALGARRETLMGLSGLGDLMLTCASPQSRNMAFGLALGEGADPEVLLAETGPVVEGAHTAEALIALAQRHGVEMPLAEAVRDVVSKAITVPQAISLLMARPLRAE